MSAEIIASVNNLKDELEKRIQLLTSGTTSANLNKDTYDELVSIITSYTHMSSSRLTSEDITNFRLKDIERILDIICVDDNTKKMIINSFNSNVYSVKNSRNQTRVLELMKFFEEIRKIILGYIDQFETINSNQQSVQDTKVSEYRFYIDLFSKESFEKLFTEEEIEKLLKLMSNIAIPVSDRQHILQYVAEQNLRVPKQENPRFSEEHLNLMSKVNNLHNTYVLGHGKEKDDIESELDSNEIDIDLLPTIAKDIAQKKRLDENLVCGILISMVSSSLLNAYEKALEDGMPEEIIHSYKTKLEDVLSLEDNKEYSELSSARKIIADTHDFYTSQTTKGVNVGDYLDMLLTEIESTGVDRETAIDLKTLPLIKSISETLDKIDKLDKNSEDYSLCRGMLYELTQAYQNLVEKKKKIKRKD